MPTSIAFSDEQLDAIMRAAQPLAPPDRERFVEAVRAALQGREIGDGTVYLAIREAQRQFFAPPVLDQRSRPGGGGNTT
jgi:hypothetical protein